MNTARLEIGPRVAEWPRGGLLAAALMAAIAITSCSKSGDVIIETAAGVELGAAEIDRDPLALLPGGAVSVMRLDAQAMFASPFGQRLTEITRSRLPLPPSAGFEPTRDLSALYVGLYSMQGVDFAMVASGVFDPSAIERAADGTSMTPLGAPLVKTEYAERTLYVSRNVGFVVLTSHTVLLGNETGIRRALDRIRSGRVQRDVPEWLESMLLTPNAPMVAGVDLTTQPAVEVLAGKYPFLAGLKTGRVLGNFQPPGMNFAGTLGYGDEQQAAAAAGSLTQLNTMLRTYSWFMALAGMSNPIQRMQVQPQGRDAQFVAEIDTQAVQWLIGLLADQTGVPPAPIQATVGGTPAPGQAGGTAPASGMYGQPGPGQPGPGQPGPAQPGVGPR